MNPITPYDVQFLTILQHKNLKKFILEEERNVSDVRNVLSLNHHWHDAVMDSTLETHLKLQADKENIHAIIAMLKRTLSGNGFKNLKHLGIEFSESYDCTLFHIRLSTISGSVFPLLPNFSTGPEKLYGLYGTANM